MLTFKGYFQNVNDSSQLSTIGDWRFRESDGIGSLLPLLLLLLFMWRGERQTAVRSEDVVTRGPTGGGETSSHKTITTVALITPTIGSHVSENI